MSNSSSYKSTDQTTRSEQPSSIRDLDMWNGGQASQAAWLNACLKRHENDYDYSQLNESGTVLTDKGGKVAVFTPEHGHDHASGANRGTTRAPNMRMRESLARFHTLPGTPSPPMTHGGYPTPSSVPPDTSGVKPPTMLQNALGELADGYRDCPRGNREERPRVPQQIH